MKAVTFIAALLCVAMSYAEDIELLDGRVLKNVRVIDSTPIDIMVIHSGGAENVALEACPPAIQKRFKYEPAKADEFLEKKSAQAQERQQRQTEQQELAEKRLEERRKVQSQKPAMDAPRWRIVGKILSVTDGGLLVMTESNPTFRTERLRPPVYPQKHYQDANPLSMSERNKREQTKRIWENHLARSKQELATDVVFLMGFPAQSSIVDETFIDVFASPVGTYKYGAVSGASKTVRKYVFTGQSPFLHIPGEEEKEGRY